MAVSMGLAQAESMDMTNDPRFFAKNIMDKRLAAFKILSIVSALMFGTSLGQCFSMKKNFDFEKWDPLVGSIAVWQIISFFLSLLLAFVCLLALYIIAHQLFYTYRLMTAGPSGFEQAAIFYLTRGMTMWRHAAIKMLFYGLLLFLVTVGMQLFVLFYKDALSATSKKNTQMVMNLDHGVSVNRDVAIITSRHTLCMKVHIALGYASFTICTLVAILMLIIRREHLQVFQENYTHCSSKTRPVSIALRAMSTRAGVDIEG
jgi:hypothetical protein